MKHVYLVGSGNLLQSPTRTWYDILITHARTHTHLFNFCDNVENVGEDNRTKAFLFAFCGCFQCFHILLCSYVRGNIYPSTCMTVYRCEVVMCSLN